MGGCWVNRWIMNSYLKPIFSSFAVNDMIDTYDMIWYDLIRFDSIWFVLSLPLSPFPFPLPLPSSSFSPTNYSIWGIIRLPSPLLFPLPLIKASPSSIPYKLHTFHPSFLPSFLLSLSLTRLHFYTSYTSYTYTCYLLTLYIPFPS